MDVGFDVVAGDADSPVVLHVPHAATAVPGWVRGRLLLSDPELEAELARMTDAWTDQLAAAAGSAVSPRPWQFVNRLSRLVVDPERFPDDREEMNAVGMGAVYERTSGGLPLRPQDTAHRAELIRRYFHPYSNALAAVVDERIAAAGGAVIIDVHSFPREALPYERHQEAARPQVCLGTDPRHTPQWLADVARTAFAGFSIAFDEPFAGTYVPLRHFGIDDRVASIMIEIRRDTYADVAGFARIAGGLSELVRQCTDHG